MYSLTNRQARQFLLIKHGLLGEHHFQGKQGAFEYIRQCGCIQFDPVDCCGKNAELVLQSRIKGFSKQMLDELLYTDRSLFDFPDKNLSIMPVADWPYFERYRAAARRGGERFEGLAALEDQARAYIVENGATTSSMLPVKGIMHWYSQIHWSGAWDGESNAARAVLEQLYSTGELVIHHKQGTRKHYDLATRHIPCAILDSPDPLPDDAAHRKWRVLRRVGAVGLLWNRPSDAWLNIQGLSHAQRDGAFSALLDEGKLLRVEVEGLSDALYCRAEDAALLEFVCGHEAHKSRCEFLAPLDCLMWDRKLIRALFGFNYTWEIYTPSSKRKYGHYVLPILHGDRFVGRIEAVNDRKTRTLLVKNIWYEEDVRRTKRLQDAVQACVKRFARFNACTAVRMP